MGQRSARLGAGPRDLASWKRSVVPQRTIRSIVPFCKPGDGGCCAVTDSDSGSGPKAPRKRADAQRNEQALLDAAAKVFVVSGVDAPVRDIAAAAGVGMGTIYRHFPTPAELIIAGYQHQGDAT